MPRTGLTRRAAALTLGAANLIGSCGSIASGHNETQLLPARTAAPDTTRITDAIRQNGGNVFVQLTGNVNDAALEKLRHSGLGSPAGSSLPGPIVFLRVSPLTVWGFVQPGGVRRVAELNFVTLIESSADADGIFRH
jgi:hypothetical protein